MKEPRCPACHERLGDNDEASCWSDDFDNVVHVRCPIPGRPANDPAVIVGLGASRAERDRSEGAAVIDRECAVCGHSMAGATSSWSIVVDDEGGGQRFTVCPPCFEELEDDDRELVAIF
jgi:hypothetical protein